MDYCTPSFANRHFAPSYHPSNVALNKSALTSSEELNLAWPRHAGNALDGDLCTKWSSASGAHEWLVIDLGAPHELHNMSIFWDVDDYATDYLIETSLDRTFETSDRALNPADSSRHAKLSRILFQTVAAPFASDPSLALEARQRFKRRHDERYVQVCAMTGTV
jgi:hypothetical protein